MSRLDEIEENWNSIWCDQADADKEWLIQRVRELETWLADAQHNADCICNNSYGDNWSRCNCGLRALLGPEEVEGVGLTSGGALTEG